MRQHSQRTLNSLSGKPVRTTAGERYCCAKDCTTRLSRYNHDDTCALHSQPRGQKPRNDRP